MHQISSQNSFVLNDVVPVKAGFYCSKGPVWILGMDLPQACFIRLREPLCRKLGFKAGIMAVRHGKFYIGTQNITRLRAAAARKTDLIPGLPVRSRLFSYYCNSSPAGKLSYRGIGGSCPASDI